MLENVVLMLWPTINPDGQQMVAEWYMKNVGTPFELSGLPRLYQEYVGHDNNRDAYMLNMIESRVIEYAWRQWEPQIVYVHHQVGPFPTRIWLPPFSEPVGLEAPAVIAREVNMLGMAMAKNLDEKGQPGATHMGTAFDAWYPGYIDYAPIFKNIAAYWTETALFSYATPHEYTIADFPQNMRDLRPQSLYSSPWKPGWWRLRDAVDYMETASLATIEFASKYKDSLLMNRYRAGRDQIALGATKAPYAYTVPKDQRDPVAAVEMLRRLAFGGVRVYDTDAAWVIPTDQEFAAMAREVLDAQRYPDLRQYPGGPPERPYDAAGWSLPLQMGVRVVAAATALAPEVRASMKLVGQPTDYRKIPTEYPSTNTDAAATRNRSSRPSRLRLSARMGKARPSRNRASASTSRGAVAWTRAGRAGCSSSTGSISSRSVPQISTHRLQRKLTLSCCPTRRVFRSQAVCRADRCASCVPSTRTSSRRRVSPDSKSSSAPVEPSCA